MSVYTKIDELKKEVDVLVTRANDVIGPAMKLLPYRSHKDFNWRIYGRTNIHHGIEYRTEYFFTSGDRYTDVKVTQELLNKVLAQFDVTTEQYLASLKETYEENVKVIEHNQKLYNKIVEYMGVLGVHKTYTTYEYKTTRSTKKTSETHTAGFIKDLERVLQLKDIECAKIQNSITEKRKDIVKFGTTALNETKKKEAEQLAKQTEIDKVNDIALLRVKYSIKDIDTRIIHNEIICKNRYLYLAHHLQLNRGDWSDGYSYADDGIDFFINGMDRGSTVDNDIVSEITQLISDGQSEGDFDGRVFRDCHYSYDRLFSMVSEESPDLYADYLLISKYERND